MTRLTCIAFVWSLAVGGAALAKNTSTDDMSGKKEHQMVNCPSAVSGAKTAVRDTKDGVIVTVTAAEDTARKEIQRRAHRQEQVAMQSARGAIEHTGGGTGSGKFGFCPGMIEGTRVAVDELPDGARLTVRAASEPQARSLQTMTRERLRALSAKR